jgi:uncharacterized membrane protein YtjA (UPF0391 family)
VSAASQQTGGAPQPELAPGVCVSLRVPVRVVPLGCRFSCWSGPRRDELSGERLMLKLALFFLVVSIIAAVFGFTGIASAAAGIAKILFFIAFILFMIFLIVALLAGAAFF